VSAQTESQRARALWAWLPAIAYMTLIWILSSGPVTLPIDRLPFKDKGAHLIEYGALAVLNGFAIRRTFAKLGFLRGALLTAFLTFVWGFLDELHQAFVPSRNSDIYDLMVDTIAGVLGAFGYFTAARLFGNDVHPADRR
jgi:hypothetical protein